MLGLLFAQIWSVLPLNFQISAHKDYPPPTHFAPVHGLSWAGGGGGGGGARIGGTKFSRMRTKITQGIMGR